MQPALKRICRLLARLASEAIQVRFIQNATKDRYLLPTDVLNDALTAIEAVAQRLPWAASLNEHDREAVLSYGLELKNALGDADIEAVPWHELVHHCKPWVEARDVTRHFLEALDFDLTAYERAELE
jgi:hypothetical protein